MKLPQYLIESARVVAPASDADLFVHAALGIATELQELGEATTVQNALEEIGDVMWYVAILMRAQNANSFDELKTNSAYTIAAQLSPFGAAAAICDAAKRHKFYGTPMPWATVNFALKNIEGMLNTCCMQARHPLEAALGINIEKLRARYPQGFAQAKAETRNLLEEERAMAAAIVSGAQMVTTPPVQPEATPAPAPAKLTATQVLEATPPPTRPKLTRIVGPGGQVTGIALGAPTGPTTVQR
jgi:hypothetical protein